LFEFGKSATRYGDANIVSKHFCTGYIEAIRKIIYILERTKVPVYFPGEPRRLLVLDNALLTLHFWDPLYK